MSELTIGLTERHGMAQEQLKYPPKGFKYEFLDYLTNGSKILKSPMKGFMCRYGDDHCDVVEAVLTPAKTRKPWFYSLARYEEAIAFSYFGLPTPREIRTTHMSWLFNKPNFKGLLFWSEAGLQTMHEYTGIGHKRLLEKAHVVYPTIGQAAPDAVRYSNDKNVKLLFNGNFFVKGGANVVDVFEKLQTHYKDIELRLCCDLNIDFHTGDPQLRKHYLQRIEANPAITMGRVPRETFTNELLPNTDIYILPTYADAFGFAVLEAMSYGVPVISTNYLALPEIVDHDGSGYLIDISQYDCNKMFKGCVVNHLPQDFQAHINQHLEKYLVELIENPELRKTFGERGRQICKNKFSVEKRQEKVTDIYHRLL